MVKCVVFECGNNIQATDREDISFYQLPGDKKLRLKESNKTNQIFQKA